PGGHGVAERVLLADLRAREGGEGAGATGTHSPPARRLLHSCLRPTMLVLWEVAAFSRMPNPGSGLSQAVRGVGQGGICEALGGDATHNGPTQPIHRPLRRS